MSEFREFPKRIRIALVLEYDEDIELEDDYDEWLGDQEDSRQARREFVLDRFIPPNFRDLCDPNVEIEYVEEW